MSEPSDADVQWLQQLVERDDLREPVIPHRWDAEAGLWTCSLCGARRSDPCDCGCHAASPEQLQGLITQAEHDLDAS